MDIKQKRAILIQLINHKGYSMDDNATLSQLEELAQRVGITVRYEPLKIEGFIHTGGKKWWAMLDSNQ